MVGAYADGVGVDGVGVMLLCHGGGGRPPRVLHAKSTGALKRWGLALEG